MVDRDCHWTKRRDIIRKESCHVMSSRVDVNMKEISLRLTIYPQSPVRLNVNHFTWGITVGRYGTRRSWLLHLPEPMLMLP